MSILRRITCGLRSMPGTLVSRETVALRSVIPSRAGDTTAVS